MAGRRLDGKVALVREVVGHRRGVRASSAEAATSAYSPPIGDLRMRAITALVGGLGLAPLRS